MISKGFLTFLTLKSTDAAENHGRADFPQFQMAIQQLPGAFHIVGANGRAHMGMMKSMQIVACVEHDKRVVQVMRHSRRLAYLEGVSEIPVEVCNAGKVAGDRAGVVQDQQQPVGGIFAQKLP